MVSGIFFKTMSKEHWTCSYLWLQIWPPKLTFFQIDFFPKFPPQCFESVTSILFMASTSEFDQVTSSTEIIISIIIIIIVIRSVASKFYLRTTIVECMNLNLKQQSSNVLRRLWFWSLLWNSLSFCWLWFWSLLWNSLSSCWLLVALSNFFTVSESLLPGF